MQNFKAILRLFIVSIENSYWNKFDVEWSQLSKTVRELKIGQKMAIGPSYYIPYIVYCNVMPVQKILAHKYSFWCTIVDAMNVTQNGTQHK